MSKKFFVAFSLLLLVVVAGGVYYYFMFERDLTTAGKTEIDTNNSETYQSEQFGYQLGYPKKVVLRVGKVNTTLLADDLLGVPQELKDELKEAEVSRDGDFLSTSISVFNLPNPNNLSITDWMGTNRADIIKSADSQRDIVFQNIPALLLEREDRGFEEGKYAYHESTIYFFHQGNLFSIRSIAPPKNPTEEWRSHPYYHYLEKSVPITQAIIDSFRFVE